jgi:hypothetical protein
MNIMPSSAPPRGSLQRIARIVSIVSEMATLMVQVRGRPKLLDILALSTKAVDIGFKIHSEVMMSQENPWLYFGSGKGRGWITIPSIFKRQLVPLVTSHKQVTKVVGDGVVDVAWEGDVLGIKVGWIGDEKGDKVSTAFVEEERLNDLLPILRNRVWASVQSNHAVLTEFGLEDDKIVSDALISTNLIESLTHRVHSFLKSGEPRSYLIVGGPGTGKTTSIQHIARSVDGFKSLRIPLAELTQIKDRGPHGAGEGVPPISFIVDFAMPDVLIIDDIDRASKNVQDEFLAFMDANKKSVKVLLASANRIKKVTAALRRPERFDEHVNVPELDEEAARGILGSEYESVYGLMKQWPITYLLEYMKRVRTLGSEQARKEIGGLQARLDMADDTELEDMMAEALRR